MSNRPFFRRPWLGATGILTVLVGTLWTGDVRSAPPSPDLVQTLRAASTECLSAAERDAARDSVRRNLRQRIQEANDRSSAAWREIHDAKAWERFVAPRRDALVRSLGTPYHPGESIEVHVTATLPGDGFTIENLVFNSRPNCWISANLYRPSPRRARMPGIIICHSHHTPKTHGELQDMGMTWARLGCLVLIMDQYGYGERRTHPYSSAEDYPKPFQVGRQDYYFRYDNGIQFHLAGQSLIGQFVWELRRGVDLLMKQPGIDPERIILLGSVAGGGDPAAVAGMIDQRFAAVVPFNFGGPQPETRYPLPEDAERTFNYAGSGSWESTRNLRNSARDGFLPWVIVGGIAPRALVFAHEFNWDQPRDPVWKRLQTIYGWYGRTDYLTFTHGHGEVTESAATATHCTHIGRIHRQRIHSAFARWFAIPDGTDREYSRRRETRELLCWTNDLRQQLPEIPLRTQFALLAQREFKTLANDRNQQRRRWSELIGDIPDELSWTLRQETSEQLDHDTTWRRCVLASADPEIHIPLVLITRSSPSNTQRPIVVMVSQEGKQAILKARASEIAHLLSAGVDVCLPDLRGTGETRPDDGRERRSSSTSLSSTEFMLGGTMVGARVRDLLTVLQFLRSSRGTATNRIVLWGDSLAPVNPSDTIPQAPHGIDGRPHQCEPLGGLAALLGALVDNRIEAIYIRGGLVSFASAMEQPCVFVPHDAILPGALNAGDLPTLASLLSPTPLRLDQMVDGLNRRVPSDQVARLYKTSQEGPPHVTTSDSTDDAVAWLLNALAR